jgi:hypothetical protein
MNPLAGSTYATMPSVLRQSCRFSLLRTCTSSSVPVVFLDVVCHRLWLMIAVMRVVWIVRWTNVFHFVDAATFVASLVWAVTGDLMIN